MDSCHVCGQVRQQTDESGQQTKPDTTGLRRADASSVPFRHVQLTATSTNVRGDGIDGSGPPNRQSPQLVPSLRLCRQYLPHLHLFVLLGPDGNPVVGAAVVLRPNSRRSNICELLDDANSSQQFAAAGLTRNHRWICMTPDLHRPASPNTAPSRGGYRRYTVSGPITRRGAHENMCRKIF